GHQRGDGLDGQQRAGDVDLMHVTQVGGRDVEQPGPPGYAGVGDQPVDPAEPSGQVLSQNSPAAFVGDVQLAVLGRGEILGRLSTQVDGDDGDTTGGEPSGLGRALSLPGAGDDHDAHGGRFLVRGRGRAGRTGGSSAPGTTVLRMVPMPSTVISTTSPGRSGGGSSWPRRPHSSARQPPLPQVPEPSTSPARTQVPREAYARSSSNGQPMLDSRSWPVCA